MLLPKNDERLTQVASCCTQGQSVVLGAVHGAFAAVLISELFPLVPTLARVVVTADPQSMADDLEELGLDVELLPELDRFEDGHDDADMYLRGRRQLAMERFLAGQVLVMTPAAFEQTVPDPANLESDLVLKFGVEVQIHALAEKLMGLGYQLAHMVESPGEVCVRGGILDIFPFSAEHPVRVETLGDSVDSLRRFDPATQESFAKIESLRLKTAPERAGSQRPFRDCLQGKTIISMGDQPLSARLKMPLKTPELRLARHSEQGCLDGASLGIERFRGDLHKNFQNLKEIVSEHRIQILCRSEDSALDLKRALSDAGVSAQTQVGRFSAGYHDLGQGLLVVHDFELAHRQPARRRKEGVHAGAALSSILDLKAGDYVVHLSHGIGRFKGMTTIERSGYHEDCLLLEFAEGTRIYVPTTAIDCVQKYIGGAGRHPPLDKVGGLSWRRRREKAEKAVEDLTAELLAAQAKRQTEGGRSVPADDATIRAFEARFPYEETSDQLQAMREIKGDQESNRSMDRLLCGDVGFGKTELAIRAAMKIVRGGRQTMLLAPTTLLAEQHLQTFQERFEGTDVRIACIDRFRNRAERLEIIDNFHHHRLDILIGTHAILSDAIRPADLGLIIVDEEQRFGVKHKEALKRWRAGADVLTLSATPIPRTLHMGLMGLRDISILAEPPPGRQAVTTRVAPWDKELVHQAIQREIERGGQVFIVHHRVEDIEVQAARIRRMFDSLRMEIIHGQLPEQRINQVMRTFKHGGCDVLLATSIVESGLDIPNANTLIVTNAQAFGLAELHQLRGRVGRSSRQAFAYFLYPAGSTLNQDAQARLAAISEYSHLGAGFQLAMRDLEIRGAGNLLGSDQSGQIEAVGYELYCRMLSEAVARLGGSTNADAIKPSAATLDFALDAYIPDEWCDSSSLKFDIHKRLDACRRPQDITPLARSIRDRFGPLPDPVRRLLKGRALRLRLKELGISRVQIQGRQLRLSLDGAIPKEFLGQKVQEILHVQPTEGALVLFVRQELSPLTACGLLWKMVGLGEIV